MLDFPEQYISQLQDILLEVAELGPISAVSEEVWSGNKLKSMLEKMDVSIAKSEYNLP